MPKQPSAPTEADLVFSRASLALAKSQSLIASWLPPKTAAENAATKTEEELEKEEEEMFKVLPETLGLGATVPTEGHLSSLRGSLTANEKLKKQLFGKDWNKVGVSKDSKKSGGPITNPGRPTGHAAPKPRPNAGSKTVRQKEDSDSEEGGRSSLGKSKKRKMETPVMQSEKGSGRVADEESDDAEKVVRSESSTKRRGGSYLDELLSERSKKKNKKRKKGADAT